MPCHHHLHLFSSPAPTSCKGKWCFMPLHLATSPSLSLPVPNERQTSVIESLGFSKLGNYNSSQEIRQTHFPSILSQEFYCHLVTQTCPMLPSLSPFLSTLSIGREETATLKHIPLAPLGQSLPERNSQKRKAPISNSIYLESKNSLLYQ